MPSFALRQVLRDGSRFRHFVYYTKMQIVRAASVSLFLMCLALLSAGCAHSGLNAARENYYLGKFPEASRNLKSISGDKRNRILLLMERGTIYQAANRYKDSTTDWVNAWELAEELDYYSLSEGTSSLLVNDRIKTFQGMPYERTLLHAFAAKSYMAMEMWDDAAVEARNIIYRAKHLNKFPDNAYSRYLAAFCLEMIYNTDGAALEYTQADKLAGNLNINDAGAISPLNSKADSPKSNGKELVCFVMIGRAPPEYQSGALNYKWGAEPYAEFYAENEYLGRSYTLANTRDLLTKTQDRLAAMNAVKTVSRIAAKEIIADSVSSENEILGEILRLILYSLETNEVRRWETLPLWLQVARFPCPDDLNEYKIKFKGAMNQTKCEKTVRTPLVRRGNTYVSFCRDILPQQSPKTSGATAKAKRQ